MVNPFRTSLGVLAMAAVVCGPAKAAGPFLPHQALYELNLVKSRGSNPINSARGRILYNFSGSACEGYTSEFRQVSELDIGEGKVTLSDLRSNSWEDGAGKSYRFKIDARMNDSDSSPVDGIAERTGDHITVKLKQPEAKTVVSFVGGGGFRFFLPYNPELPDPAFAKIVIWTPGPVDRENLKLRIRAEIAHGLALEAQLRPQQDDG